MTIKSSELVFLEAIKAEVDKRAVKIGARNAILPSYRRNEIDARSHIEVDAQGYHLVFVERGQERSRTTTSDLDDLLYSIFREVTSEMAMDYELAHRREDQDCRRLEFRYRNQLMSSLSREWGERNAKAQETVLEQYPYDDFEWIRARRYQSLRDQGHAQGASWEMSCQQYPLSANRPPHPTVPIR